MTGAKFDRAVRRAAAQAGAADHPARDGHRRVHSGGHRGGRSCAWPGTPAADRRAEPLPGRRRGPELRRQRQAAARRASSRTSGSSRPRVMPAGRSARRCSCGTSCWTSRAQPTAPTRCAGRLAGARVQQRGNSRAISTGGAFATSFYADEANCCRPPPQAMVDGKVVGWFHGRMEFGPRALGARSIIGDARSAAMQAPMNLRIKFRESFRPFAPCVLRGRREPSISISTGHIALHAAGRRRAEGIAPTS